MHSETAPIVFLVPGDLHLTDAGLDNHRTALWAIEEANDFIVPDFVQFIGDNVQHATAEQFKLFRSVTDQLRRPWFALVGDHDVHNDPEGGAFRHHVGNPYGSLSLRGFRFLRLNTQEARPVGLSDEQLRWFRAEIDAAQQVGERVIVFQHNYPYQIWEDYAGPGIDEWRALVQTRRITALFTGHTHYWQIANDGRNALVTTRSIGDPEGGPPGYLLGLVHGEDLAVTYRSVEDRGPLVLITHPRGVLLATGPAHVVAGKDQLRVRVWSRHPVARVEAHLDDGPSFALESRGQGDWCAPLSGDCLRKGVHCLTVRAEDAAGEAGEQRLCFPVDGTGRYTAVPSVWPVVTSTAFC